MSISEYGETGEYIWFKNSSLMIKLPEVGEVRRGGRGAVRGGEVEDCLHFFLLYLLFLVYFH